MRIGIVGGGQLARMMVLAGEPLGIEFMILDPAEDATAGKIAEQVVADYDDIDALTLLASKVDVITFDFENVSAEALHYLESSCTVSPPIQALRISQDRLAEKELFQQHHIATAPFAAINSLDDLKSAVSRMGTPCILKTRRFGYDGKGQALIHSLDDCANAWQAIQQQAAILEGFVEFDYEASLIMVRNATNEIAYYAMPKNEHKQGILHISRVPFIDNAITEQAKQLLQPLIEELNYIGVLTVEFFVKDNKLIANEMAPRVHNSGHWTIEGANCSQFENHIRAISALPLGNTALSHPFSAMINFISQMPDIDDVCNIANSHIHDYHKDARTGRKVGHATVTGDSEALLNKAIEQVVDLLL